MQWWHVLIIVFAVDAFIIFGYFAVIMCSCECNKTKKPTMLVSSSTSEPLVSVIIPSYNRFEYLKKTIQSVLNQTYKHIEIIVVNDGSTKNTEAYDKANFGPTVQIIHLPENKGQSAARNEGIKQAKGEYVAFLDDDDYFLPNKISFQVRRMQETQLKMSATEALIGKGEYDEKKSYLRYNQDRYKISLCLKLWKYVPDIVDSKILNRHNVLITSGVMVHKPLLDKTGGFDERLHYAEDWDLWKRLVKYTDVLFIKEPLVFYSSSHGDGQLW